MNIALAIIFLINATIWPGQCGGSESATSSTNEEALDATGHKMNGHKEYRLGNYENALTHYSHAIAKDPSNPTLFTNRAFCHVRLNRWELAADDCRRALALDDRDLKANYILGKVFIQFGQFVEAIEALTKAQQLCVHEKNHFYTDEIARSLRLAQRLRFKHEEEKQIKKEIELLSHLNSLIEGDVNRRVEDLQLEVSNDGKASKSEHVKMEVIKAQGESYKQLLNNIFAQIDQRRQKREIPDYLICKISLELLKDPVITPNGITYDRQNILTHLRTGAHVDPVSRAPLEEDQLIPNLALKEALEQFVKENEWVQFAGDL